MLFRPAPLQKRAEVAFTSFGDRGHAGAGRCPATSALLHDNITSRSHRRHHPWRAGAWRRAKPAKPARPWPPSTSTCWAPPGSSRPQRHAASPACCCCRQHRSTVRKMTTASSTSVPRATQSGLALRHHQIRRRTGGGPPRRASSARSARGQLGSVFRPWGDDGGCAIRSAPIFQVMQAAAAGRDVVLTRPGRRDWILCAGRRGRGRRPAAA